MSASATWISKFQIKSDSWVFVPTEETIQYGEFVKLSIEKIWTPPDYYFHLMNGGHVKALKSHIKNQFFIHLDIQDFFGCINKSRVTRCLKEYFGYKIAREMAIASTVRLPESGERKFILPFGFVQSPIIASICLQKSRLGKLISSFSNANDVTVSIYMDDIIVSGNDISFLRNNLEVIKAVAEKSRFKLNPEKEEGPSKKITAFNIDLTHGLLEISESRIKEFSEAYRISDNFDQRQGILGYISSVNQEQAEKLL